MVTVVDSPATAARCRLALSGEKVLALDCEGVNLGRRGEVSLIQIATPSECFLLDVQGNERTAVTVALAKEILEDASVCKIIHDCRADSDALFHLLGIELKNVHDTQAWDMVRFKTTRLSLNNLLQRHDLPSNAVRDKTVYEANERFWAVRPLTQEMIEWASGDVTSLFLLREAQRLAASAPAGAMAKKGAEASEANLKKFREVGMFIGRGGSNIRTLEQTFNVTPRPIKVVFLIHAGDEVALLSALTYIKLRFTDEGEERYTILAGVQNLCGKHA